MDIVKRECYRPAANGLGEVFTRVIRPQRNCDLRGAVQIAHGMAEHSGRYEQFGCFLAEHGFAVYANDHVGHGRSVGPSGYFGDADGWGCMVEDMRTLTEGLIRKDAPGVPVFLIGHSMGSILVRSYMACCPGRIAGVVLIGPPPPNKMAALAQSICRRAAHRGGGEKPNAVIHEAIMHTYNRKNKKAKSPFEWLCSDQEVVRSYNGDPMCGFPFTNRGYYDLATGLRSVSGKGWAQHVPEELPVLLLAGKRDAAAGYGTAPRRISRQLREGGLTHVESKVYEGARHELLNEYNREEVFSDILAWLEGHLGQTDE